MRIEQSPENRVEQHASWIAVNPVIGCPYGCEYCFLGPDQLRPVKPEELVDPASTIADLLDSKFYTPDIPVAIGTRTDMFATPKNQDYVREWLDEWEVSRLENPLIFITKGGIPDDIAERMGGLRSADASIIVFLSISGLDNEVERGVNHERLIDNIDRLASNNVPAVHYWRPLMPQNSTQTKMDAVHSVVNQRVSSSFVGGLRLTEDMKTQVPNWPEVLEIDTEHLDSAWDADGYDYIQRLRKLNPAHPIFEAVSCTLALATETPEYNGVFGTDMCNRSNCPDEQREICGSSKVASNEEIEQALDRLGYGDTAFSADEEVIVVHDELPVDTLTNLIHSTGMRVESSGVVEDGYGWGNHHTREHIFIPRETLPIMKPQSFIQLDAYQMKTMQSEFIRLKKEFAVTEQIEWDALVVAGELNLQTAHLSMVMNHASLREQHAPQLESLSDEFADIIFNCLNLLSFYDIEIDEGLMKIIADQSPTGEDWLSEIQALSGLVWDSTAKTLGYKTHVNDEEETHLQVNLLVAGILGRLAHAAKLLKIENEIKTELNSLCAKSRDFIQKHEN